MSERLLEAGKSFWMYGTNTEDKCFGCSYCIIHSDENLNREGRMIDKKVGVVPTTIDNRLNLLPVAINNCFGDPGSFLWQDTVARLSDLEKFRYQGPVAIITKSYLSPAKAERLATSTCQVVVLQSISGLPSPIEPDNTEKRIQSIKNLIDKGVKVVAYLRPFIPGINDDPDQVTQLIDRIAQVGCKAFCYSGLKGTSEVISSLEQITQKPINPPDGYSSWQPQHKLISPLLKHTIETYCRTKEINVFRKTSCSVSHALGLESDYNCHWNNPDKWGCRDCVMVGNCLTVAASAEESRYEKINSVRDIFKTSAVVVNKPKESGCQLKEVCSYPCSSCPGD